MRYSQRTKDSTNLTAADYEAAMKRWNANGPADYELDLDLTGNRPGKIRIPEVRRGAVHAHDARFGESSR